MFLLYGPIIQPSQYSDVRRPNERSRNAYPWGNKMKEELFSFLAPTAIIDSDHKTIRDYSIKNIGTSEEPVEIAVKLYLAVRDNILYDPYSPFYLPEHYRASYVLQRGRSFCVPKASLLCALARACGIPARIDRKSVV